MTMQGWITKLDDFLRLGDRDILTHAGRVTADAAKARAQAEYDKWHAEQMNAPSAVEGHFIEATAKAKRIAAARPKAKPKGKPKGKGARASLHLGQHTAPSFARTTLFQWEFK